MTQSKAKFAEKAGWWIFFGLVVFFAAFFITPQVLAEEIDKPDPAVVALQTEVKGVCDRLSTILSTWEMKLPNVDNYVNLRVGVSFQVGVNSGGIELPAILSSFSQPVRNKRVALSGNCSTAQTSQALISVQTAYNNIKNLYIEEVAVKALGLLDKLNDLYGKAKSAGETRNMVSAVNSQPEFYLFLKKILAPGVEAPAATTFEPTVDGKAILTELNVMESQIVAITADMPVPAFYSNIFTKTPDAAAGDIATVNNKVAANTAKLSTISKSFSRTLRPTQNILTLAAKDGIAPESVNALLRAKYSPLYDDYKLRAKKSCDSLKKNIGAIRPRLFSNAESIEAAYPSVSAATKTSLKEQINVKIAALDALTAAVGAECAVSFNFVNGKTGEFNSLNLSRVMLPVISSLKAFDRHVAGANKLNTFYNTWNNSQDQLDGALTGKDNPNKLDRMDFSKFGGEIAGAYPTALEPLVTTRKTEVESSLLATAASGKVEDLKIAKTKVSVYSKDLGSARKQFGDFQKRWWQFINQAAVEGIVKNLESDLPALKDEVRAAKLFQDFNKRRESYYAQAKKIVEERTSAVTKKQAKVDAAAYVPGEVKTALAFKTKTDTFLATLARYLNEVILVQNNYFDLRASLIGSPEFIGLKNFGVNNYIRTQDTYIRLDNDYKKAAILEGILNGEVVKINLNERITALESNTNKATEAQLLRSTYNGILASVSEYRGKMNTFITTELASVLTDPDNNDLYLAMRTKEKEVRLVYGTIVSQVKILTADIRTLEKKP